MTGGFKITLKAGDRIFINGAALKVDRKVGLELLNDVAFLLEQHIMTNEDATTPLRQLYLVIQSMLTEPAERNELRVRAMESIAAIQSAAPQHKVGLAVEDVRVLLAEERPLDALKKIRAALALEVPVPLDCATQAEKRDLFATGHVPLVG